MTFGRDINSKLAGVQRSNGNGDKARHFQTIPAAGAPMPVAEAASAGVAHAGELPEVHVNATVSKLVKLGGKLLASLFGSFRCWIGSPETTGPAGSGARPGITVVLPPGL